MNTNEKENEISESGFRIELEEEEEVNNSLWSVIKLPWYEYILVALLIGAAVTMFVLHNYYPDDFGILIGVVVAAGLLGLWLAFRPSEWAVDGLGNLMRFAGLTAYVAGVISSLASNLPEAVAAGILLVKGTVNNTPDLVKTAFYTTLAAAGFNAILLGIVVLVGSKKKGYIQIKKETVMAESVLLRWGFVATFLTFGVAVVEILDKMFIEIKQQTFFEDSEGISGELPQLAGISLVVSYLIYLVFLIVKSKQAKAEEQFGKELVKATKPMRGKLDEKMPDIEAINVQEVHEGAKRKMNDASGEMNIIDPNCEDTRVTYQGDDKKYINPYATAPAMEGHHLSLKVSIALVILGVTGIAGGGFLLSHAVETMLHSPKITLDIGIVALIVGFSGAIPEHGIAVVASAKGKTDIALGNILGGILQMTLLVFGAFAALVPAPIDDFMLFQLIALALIIWFVKRSISDDHRITSFEGIMIIMAQSFSFLLLIGELTNISIF